MVGDVCRVSGRVGARVKDAEEITVPEALGCGAMVGFVVFVIVMTHVIWMANRPPVSAWEQYAIDHRCTPTATVRFVDGWTYTGGEREWVCRDGQRYWRRDGGR